MPIELKPCPFCGGTKLKIDQKTSSTTRWNSETKRLDKLVVVTVRCNKCHTRGPTTSMWGGWYDRPVQTLADAAAEAWNRRADDATDCCGCAERKSCPLLFPTKMEPCGHIPVPVQAVVAAEIEQAPTIEAEPVRHGRWVNDLDENGFLCSAWRKCSVCGGLNFSKRPPYCPNCGAKMDGDSHD